MIRFLCPNGHSLSSNDDLAGKPGQCPRCQSQFVVPELDDAADGDEGSRIQVACSEKAAHATIGADEDKLEFLCPNGHKLHGASSLQGRPGQCPHCNARFLIPTEEEVAAAESSDAASRAVGAPENGNGDAESGSIDDLVIAAAEPVVINFHDQPPPPPMPVSCHPLAQIIRKLWAETRGAGVMQLRLDNEETLLAESFSAELSQHEFGVFAVRGENKTPAVTILPWDRKNRAT